MTLKFLKYFPIFLVIAIVFSNIFINLKFKNKILPNTYISGIYVGNLTQEQALEKVKILVPANKNITLATSEKDYVFNSNYFKFDYDLKDTVTQAYLHGRSKNEVYNLVNKIKCLVFSKNIPFSYFLIHYFYY